MRVPFLAALIGFVSVILLDLYIFFDIRSYTRRRRHRKIALAVYAVFSLLCWALLAVALFLPKRSAEVSILPQMWMVFILLSIYIPKLIYVIFSAIGRLVSRGRSRLGAAIGWPVATLVFVIMWWGVLFTRHDIHTNDVEIVSDRLPAAFDGYKVLQFSDAHVGTWGNDTVFISRLVDSINSKNADLILFTGDIVNRCSAELDPFVPVLRRLRAKDGVMAIWGNHDYDGYMDWNEPGDALKDLHRRDSLVTQELGWTVLANSRRFIKAGSDSIAVIGVENWGEPPFTTLGDLTRAYPVDSVNHGPNDSMFKILMSHNPAHWEKVVKYVSNIDLTLSGHTHAMQMMLKLGDWRWSPSKYRYPLWGGLYTETASDGTPMRLYVNIGVGEVGFPARVGAAYPELTLFTLKSSK